MKQNRNRVLPGHLVVKSRASDVEGTGSIPGQRTWGTKIPTCPGATIPEHKTEAML